MKASRTFGMRSILLLSAGLASALTTAAQAAPARANSGVRTGVAQLPAGAQRPVREVRLSIGEGELINLPASVASVWVANPAVADVNVNSARQINLFGKAFGETTVFATSASGAVVYAATIRVSQNVSSLDAMLKVAMPEADIKITHVGTIAVMTGTIGSHEDSSQAETLVKGLLNPGGGTQVQVINRLRTALPMQVNLQVRFAEVSRSLMRVINANLTTMDATGGIKFGIGRGRTAGNVITTDPNLPLGVGNSPSGYTIDPVTGTVVLRPGTDITTKTGISTAALLGRMFGMNFLAAIDAGETVGLVSTLSSPNLTALSGETAEFLAGGQFPIPMSQGLGSTSIDYKNYGVSLSYTPTVLSSGRISIRVRPEVSELSSQGAVQLNGYQVPALTIRRAETTVELGSGQSFMIAGLMSNNAQNTIEKTPGAGDLPILGSLFRSTSFQRGETELVIIVTPYLVGPVNAADIKLPTDGYSTPNELQRILGNVNSDSKSNVSRPMPRAAGEKAPDPSVSLLEQAPAVPAPAAAPRSQQRKQTASAGDVPAPGFGLD